MPNEFDIIDQRVTAKLKKRKEEDDATVFDQIDARVKVKQEERAKPTTTTIAPPPKRTKPVSSYVEPGGMYSGIFGPQDTFQSNVAKATERNKAVAPSTSASGTAYLNANRYTPPVVSAAQNIIKPKPITITTTETRPATGKAPSKVEVKVDPISQIVGGGAGGPIVQREGPRFTGLNKAGQNPYQAYVPPGDEPITSVPAQYQGAPVPAKGLLGAVANTFSRPTSPDLLNTARAYKDPATGETRYEADPALKMVLQASGEQKFPMTAGSQAAMQGSEDKGFWGGLLDVITNPLASAEIGLRSIGSAGLVPSALTAMPNPLARTLGAYLGSQPVEEAARLGELMRERYLGLDITNYQAVENAIASDPEFWQTALKQAKSASEVVAVSEGLSAAIAGPAAKVGTKNPLAKRLVSAVAERLTDMFIAGAGEGTAQVTSGMVGGKSFGQALGDVRGSDVAWEAGSEFVAGAPQLAGALMQRGPTPAAPVAPPSLTSSSNQQMPVLPPLDVVGAARGMRTGEAPATTFERVQAPPPRETPVRGIAPPEAVTGRVEAPVLMNPPRVRAEGKAPAAPAADAAKEPWQMNRGEFRRELANNPDRYIGRKVGLVDAGRNMALYQEGWTADLHKQLINEAIQDGKPIPASVLAEYPELAKPAKPAAGEGEIAKEPWMMTKDDLNYKWDYSEKGNPRVTNEAARVNSDRVNAELIGKVKVGDTFEWVGKNNQKRNATITKVTPAGKNETFAGEWFTVELDEHPYHLPGTEGGAAKTMDGLSLADLARNGFSLSDIAPAKSAGKGKGGEVAQAESSVFAEDIKNIESLTSEMKEVNRRNKERIVASGIDTNSSPLTKNDVAIGETLYDHQGREWIVGKYKRMIPQFSQVGIQGVQNEIVQGKEYPFTDPRKTSWGWNNDVAIWRRGKPSPAPVAPAKSAQPTGEKRVYEVAEYPAAIRNRSVLARERNRRFTNLLKARDDGYTTVKIGKQVLPINKAISKIENQIGVVQSSELQKAYEAQPSARMEIKPGTFEIDATGDTVTSRQVGAKPVPTVPRKNAAVAKEAKKRGEAKAAETEVNTPFRPAVSDFGEKNTLVTKSEADAALERVLRKTGRLSANIDPTVIKDMAKVGAYYLEGGIRQFGDWAAKMRGHFGKDSEPYLRRIYTLSNGNLSKLRKFPQSVKDAPIAPAELTEKINENPPTYEPISNEATLQAAQARIDADVSGGHVTWRGIIAKQKMTAEDVAVGEDLIRRAINEGRIDEANLLTTELAEMLTQAGQTVQAASMIKRMTPEGMLVFAKRALDRANALLPEKAKTANLSDVDAARIVNLMKRKAELAVEGDLDAFVRKYEELIKSKEFTPAQTRALRLILKRDVLNASDRDAALTAFRKRIDDVLTARVMQIIADAHPVTFGDRLRALQRISMLLNPKTVLSRNVLGNVLMNAVTNFSETLAIPVDVAVKVFTKKSTATAPSLTTQGGAFAKGVRNVVDDIRLGVDTSPSRTQFELPQGRVFHSNFWNGLDQVVRRGLTFGDRPFYEAAYEEALRQYMRTNSLTEATVEAKEYATRVAQIKTYVDTNTISEAFEGLRNTLNGDPTGRKGTKFGFGNIVLPFTKTPANILARALDFSVGGAVRTARAAGLKRGGGFDQRAFVKNLSQTLTGAGLIIAGYTLTSMGMLRGAPEKKKRKEQFLRATGKSPYSYYVGGYSYTYDWAQPASFLIAMGANMHQTGVSKEDATTRVTEAVIAGGDTLFNMSVMQGLRGLVGYGSVVEGLMETALDTPLQAVPTVTGQTARSIDSTMRMTYSPSELDSVMRKMKARVPFLSRTLQPRINIRGEKALYAGGAFAQYLSPANIAKIEEGAVDKEILRLYAITGDSEVFPRAVQPRFSYEKKEYILTPEQYTKFQQLVGTTTYIGLARIFSESSYKLNDEQGRADMAQKVVRAAYNSAKAHILLEEYGVTVGSSSGPPKPPSPPKPPKPPGRAY